MNQELFKIFKAVNMAPGERLPKVAWKDQNHSLRKFCSAARPKHLNPQTQGKARGGDGLAKDQEEQLGGGVGGPPGRGAR